MILHIKIHHIWTHHQHKTEARLSSFTVPRTTPRSDSLNSIYRIFNSATDIFAQWTLFSLSKISWSRTLAQRNSLCSARIKTHTVRSMNIAVLRISFCEHNIAICEMFSKIQSKHHIFTYQSHIFIYITYT